MKIRQNPVVTFLAFVLGENLSVDSIATRMLGEVVISKLKFLGRKTKLPG